MSNFDWISKIGPRLRKALATLSLLFLFLLLFPFKTVIVPTWDLKVIDQSGAPVPGINVTEHWQHYLLEGSGNEELRKAGPDGRASFPERTIRASLLRRFLGTLGRLPKSGMEAKRDPYASVVVWGSKSHGTAVAVYNPESSPPSEVVTHTTP